MKRTVSGLIGLLVVLVSLRPALAQNEIVITACDYQAVVKVLTDGGNIILDCDRKIQIWPGKPLTICHFENYLA